MLKPLANENLHIVILKSYLKKKKIYANICEIFLQVTQAMVNKNVNAIKVFNNSA